jgi:hypothetical protein
MAVVQTIEIFPQETGFVGHMKGADCECKPNVVTMPIRRGGPWKRTIKHYKR